MDDKIQQQIDLEREGLALGREKFLAYAESLGATGDMDCTKPGQVMIKRLLEPVTTAIDSFRKSQEGRDISHARHAATKTADLEAEELAYIVIRRALSVVSKRTTLTGVAMQVGTAVLEELQMKHWKTVDPDYYRTTMKASARHEVAHRRRQAQLAMQRRRDVDIIRWSRDAYVHVGTTLIDLLIQATGMWHTPLKREGRKTVRYFSPTQKLADWMEASLDQLASLSPVRMPMVVPPAPWTTPYDGGYLTELGASVRLVKTRNRNYLRALETIDMPDVYDAINLMQTTAWRVNPRVLDVARDLWEAGVIVGPKGHESLPPRDPQDVPAIPAEWEGKVKEWREQDLTGYKLWAGRAAAIHEDNSRQISKRVSAAATIGQADRFRDEAEIFMPHQLDFRGRAYPIPSHLSPQGADLSRGLLQFAEGKPIGHRGTWWLKVQTANTFGIDKLAFADRVAWVDSRLDEILMSAVEPLDPQAFWRTADEPFQALAACFELARVVAGGPETLTHLPCCQDGSCNGLQNFSALLLDPVGGAATNLRPSDKPADIYMQVAHAVEHAVRQAAEAGDPQAARFDGFVTRSMVKQPVMTLPYGATKSGMRSQLEDAIRKAGNPMAIATKDMWAATQWLAKVVYEAIGTVVIAAREAMDWLQEAANAVTQSARPIHWTAPSGFPVLQEYQKLKGRKIKVHYAGKRVNVMLAEESGLDGRRQKAGIAPNFVHSLDASHMMSTVNWCAAQGIEDFAMVHDSFGTHACDVDTLNAAIRHAFVEMYSDNLLALFAEELDEQIATDKGELPPLPIPGNLDLEDVLESQYFFA